MPKQAAKSIINLDLLKPQGEPQKLLIQAFRWILSSGRFLIVFVEILVLTAFVLRFKLDADIAATSEAIEEQVPFIESLKSDEKLIRKLQFQISTISSIKQESPDYQAILQKITALLPSGITLQSLSFQKQTGGVDIKMSGSTIASNNLTSLVNGLQKETTFNNVNLVSTSFEQDQINFSITLTSTKSTKNL